MRKTRLVILPTKCLHQMGFLLLFLSCPVIGDWGRIRPESENSHNAIHIEREGSCGLQRDPPGGLLDVLNENEPKQCRLGENHDLNESMQKPTFQVRTRRSDERRADVRRISPRRDVRQERDSRVFQRSIRSRSVESRRSSRGRLLERNERVRSLSLSRLESEKTVREQRNDRRGIRREANAFSRRLSLTGRIGEVQEERRVEQRRLQRETRNDRRDEETRRALRSADRERAERVLERRDTLRENDRSGNRRQDYATRRLSRERTERDVRERTERRLSPPRMEQDNARRTERLEIRRSSERRMSPEVRAVRKTRSVEDDLERETTTRKDRRLEIRRETENRRLVNLSSKRTVRGTSTERRIETLDGIKGIRGNRVVLETKPQSLNHEPNLESKKDEAFLEGVAKWMNLKSYESPKIKDWTTNCVVGAVAYFLTSRRVKTV